jgi:hypothetical protein
MCLRRAGHGSWLRYFLDYWRGRGQDRSDRIVTLRRQMAHWRDMNFTVKTQKLEASTSDVLTATSQNSDWPARWSQSRLALSPESATSSIGKEGHFYRLRTNPAPETIARRRSIHAVFACLALQLITTGRTCSPLHHSTIAP